MNDKYLVDTSLVIYFLYNSKYSSHLRSEYIKEGKIFGSIYVRKEFLHAFVYSGVNLSALASISEDADEFMTQVSQFFNRLPKTMLQILGKIVSRAPPEWTTKSIAEKIAVEVHSMLSQYDRVFSSKTNNKVGCCLGTTNFHLDLNILDTCRTDFIRAMDQGCTDCSVNRHLNESKPSIKSLLEDDSCIAGKAASEFLKITSKHHRIDCKKCRNIGDLVISVDCPKSQIIFTTDKDFIAYCNSLNKKCLQPISFTKFHNDRKAAKAQSESITSP